MYSQANFCLFALWMAVSLWTSPDPVTTTTTPPHAQASPAVAIGRCRSLVDGSIGPALASASILCTEGVVTVRVQRYNLPIFLPLSVRLCMLHALPCSCSWHIVIFFVVYCGDLGSLHCPLPRGVEGRYILPLPPPPWRTLDTRVFQYLN